MTKIIFGLVIIFFIPLLPLLGEEEFVKALKKYPSIVTTFSPQLNKEAEAFKIKWYRTDLLEVFFQSQLTSKDNQLFIEKNPVVFLDQELSSKEIPDFSKRVLKAPLTLSKWEIEIENSGNYILTKSGELGTEGFLNNSPIILLANGQLSIKNSGKLWVPLIKGKNILFLSSKPKQNNQISIISESKFEQVQKEIIRKLNSDTKEDLEWVTTSFLPNLASLRFSSHQYIISILANINKKKPFLENFESYQLFFKLIQNCKSEFDGYMIEKYVLLNFPGIYYQLNKANDLWNGFILNNNVARTKFLEQLIFDGQNELAESYFNKCIEVISKNKEYKDVDKFIAKFYVDRFLNLFRIGRVKESIDLFKITEEKYKSNAAELKYIDYTFGNYRAGLLVKEEDILFISSFDDTKAIAIKELIEGYDGNQETLSKAYAVYIDLPNKLVKRNSMIVSLQHYFILSKGENKKFNEDFNKICQEKIQNKIDKAKESRSIPLLQELIEKFDEIISLPEIRIILLEEYFLRGSFLKALSQANFIFEKYPLMHPQIISKLTFLESSCDIIKSARKIFSDQVKGAEIKIKGVPSSIHKLGGSTSLNKTEKIGLGKFLKSIPLDIPHLQYWNHHNINFYQPIEPIFTENSILLNGANYLINYSIPSNDTSWTYHSAYEYKKDIEPGPHQKRFITSHAGNQIFMLTNKDYSEQKTVKSFDLKGNLLWDISERSDAMTEEPVCTPIEAQGKLFCLSYSNNETINSFNYLVFDSHTGKVIVRTQLSLIPSKSLDYNSYPFPRNWNTFTHDQHFTKDESAIYGFSGTGVLFSADTNSGNLLWAKGVSKSSFYHNGTMFSEYGFAPSGYIKVFGSVLLSFMPDIQIFTAVNKTSGEHIWKSKFYRPLYIHARENKEAVYFSDFSLNEETSLYKIDPLTGKIIWHVSTKGLIISGEGDILGDKLYIPSDKSLIVLDVNTGTILEVIPFRIQPLKFRSNENNSVILTSKSALIFQNDGNFKSELILENEPILNVTKLIEPDIQPPKELSFENINLELSIKVPETIFAGVSYWKRTKILKTSKPFHFLMVADEYVTLFREGYTQSNGVLVPPAVIWYGQYPSFAIADDSFYVSEYGRVSASNLFTRERKWFYEYDTFAPTFQIRREKVNPCIAVSKQYIAFQTEYNSIRVLEKETRKVVLEFSSPAVKAIRMEENFIVTLGNTSSVARCYDINQKGAEIWSQTHNNRSDIYTENGNLVFLKYSDPSINFYDLKTGLLKIQAKPTNGLIYTMNQWQWDQNFLFAYNMLYDTKTGAPITKFKECYLVDGGGYIGLSAKYGTEGVYISDGKEYPFKTKCLRDHNNFNFSAIRKGNRLSLITAWWIETFEISEEKLVLIEAIKFNSGYPGDGQFPRDMQLVYLDNSIFQARRDEMKFYKNFDVNLKYEPIKSFRVENQKKYEWPHSELYSEVEVDDKNWISFLGSESQRKMSYQAFGDEKFAYLKFKFSPLVKNEFNYILYLSGNGSTNSGSGMTCNLDIRWDPDYWDKCQISSNLTNIVNSWREVDLNGNIFLYLKFNLNSLFARNFKNTLPDFNIELRQISNKKCDGLYRIGGAYHNGRKIFPWLNYTNEEADLLSDYQLRNSMYENKVNFYPQGEDFVVWIKDRRRFYSIENNIQLLGKMLEANSKYYCSVNILSALFLEEVHLLKLKQPKLEELSDEFAAEINKIIKRLVAQSSQLGILKEWSDFALSAITIEVFPFKTDLKSDWSSKAIYGYVLKSEKRELLSSAFSEKNNPLTPMINMPYLEWIVPGLMVGFPKEVNGEFVLLQGITLDKTGIGRMQIYTPSGSQEFCNRKGVLINPDAKLKTVDGYNKQENAILVENIYFSKGIKYNCVGLSQPTIRSLLVPIPIIKSPALLRNTGQTSETILLGLSKLTSDNKNGPMMLTDYLALSGTMNEEEMKVVYGKFLHNLKTNTRACYLALRDIYMKNSNKKDAFTFIVEIMKSAKLTSAAPRLFFLEYKNIFSDKKCFAFMGPIDKELVLKPESKLETSTIYKTENNSFQFSDAIAAKKGGFIYLATKITLPEKERVSLIAKTIHYSKCTFSIWVNGKTVVENAEYINFGSNFFQSFSLNAGENTVLIKIIGAEDYEWSKYFALTIGDNFGAPISGLEMKPFNK